MSPLHETVRQRSREEAPQVDGTSATGVVICREKGQPCQPCHCLSLPGPCGTLVFSVIRQGVNSGTGFAKHCINLHCSSFLPAQLLFSQPGKRAVKFDFTSIFSLESIISRAAAARPGAGGCLFV